jgi:hypothetical protein
MTEITVMTASKQQVEWAIEQIDTILNGEDVEYDDLFGACSVLTVVSHAAFDMVGKIKDLEKQI